MKIEWQEDRVLGGEWLYVDEYLRARVWASRGDYKLYSHLSRERLITFPTLESAKAAAELLFS